VYRTWTGNALAAHRADWATVVRAVLEEAGIDPDDDELAVVGSDGRWSWELLGRSRVTPRPTPRPSPTAVAGRLRSR
jgi:hypothetical protein